MVSSWITVPPSIQQEGLTLSSEEREMMWVICDGLFAVTRECAVITVFGFLASGYLDWSIHMSSTTRSLRIAVETYRNLLPLLIDNAQLHKACMNVLKSLYIHTAEIPHPMNVTACVTLCGGGARGTVCSHCGSKHKLKVLCLAFCVSCHKKKNVAASPPNPRSCCCFVCIFFWRATRWIRAEQPACFDRISQNKSEVVQVRIMGLE